MRKPHKVELTYLVSYEVVVDANTPEEAEMIAEQLHESELERVSSEQFSVETVPMDGGEPEERFV